MVVVMKPPIFVRSFSQEEEREALEAGLRSKDAFVLRRSQILLASSRGEPPPKIAASLGCASQTVRKTPSTTSTRGARMLWSLAPRARSAPAPPSTRRAPSAVAGDAPPLSEGVRQG